MTENSAIVFMGLVEGGEIMSPKALNSDSWLTVKQMMNTNFKLLHLQDSLRTVIQYYQDCNLNTLPVVDDKDKLIGVFPKKRLYKALLDGVGLDAPCADYVVYNPIFVPSDLTYDEVSLGVRVTRSKVGNVVVVDSTGKVEGLIGKLEYLNGSLDVMRRSSTLLESLFNANFEAVLLVDNKGYILRINPAAEGIFGLNSHEIKGRHLHEVMPEINIMNKRLLCVKRNINALPVIVNQIPIYEKGSYMGTVITILDISDAEKIANELEMVKGIRRTLESIISTSNDGILVSDTKGKVKYVNERAAEMLANPSEKLLGKPIGSFIKSNKAELVLRDGLPEITEEIINDKRYVISHLPIKQSKNGAVFITGVVNRIYSDDNVLTEQIFAKLLSLKQQVNYYRSELEKYPSNCSFKDIYSRNHEFIEIKNNAHRVSRSSSTVLLTGESGVGKDMFARSIHASSPRAVYPFVKVNCAAIPETLFESELFGYAPGSFTGALKKGKTGYFEQADKGTIFLDEIGDMPLSIQVKILQVLQDKTFMRVGGSSPKMVDVRIIAATNKNLREAIKMGDFREDLFYRLNVIEFHLPPLRERVEDIIPLAKLFIAKYNKILGSGITGLNGKAGEALKNYNWPGNVRELENAIERAANYVWAGEIGCKHLPTQIMSEPRIVDSTDYRSVLIDTDKEIILKTLKKVKGNKSAAARELKISRSAFYDKLNKYGIT
jgi:PAS domain S-box-containing protein